MKTADFGAWFEQRTGFAPHPWQANLGEDARLDSRLIRIPTGFGKTLGVLAAWSFHRLVRGDESWPRRLVWCLPMRVLAEQTEAVVRSWLDEMGLLWEVGEEAREGSVGVHLLMGGVPQQEWHLHPERQAVLIGTQDMLLSRVLNRGYGSARARWPMEYALLQSDALWVLDEVQLMDVGLATSVQLQAFRDSQRSASEAFPTPAATWWMSATLQPSWLSTVDLGGRVEELERGQIAIPPTSRHGGLFSTRKPLDVCTLPESGDRSAESWADLVLDTHEASRPGPTGRITLAIANTVDGATALHTALAKRLASQEARPSLHLAHSRFRRRERSAWREAFLSREACSPDADRIIVSTQVVEAGVDVSGTTLVSQLAPWPSLVQRFGRAARYGGEANVIVVDRALPEGRSTPYAADELTAAAEALKRLEDVSPRSLESFEDSLRAEDGELVARLYPYDPLHLISFRELRELFDTGPDLTGSDLDVSRFIRSGEERDVQVWWWEVDAHDGDPSPDLQPHPDALCPVPVIAARNWLFERGRLKEGCQAWVWDYLDGTWRRALERDVYPGRTLLVDAAWGGYSTEVGWTGARQARGAPPIPTEGTRAEASPSMLADLAQHREDLSEVPYKTIATHGREAGEEAIRLTKALGLRDDLGALLELAARLHDLGKAHPVFQEAMDRERRDPELRDRQDLAKAPADVWRQGPGMFGSRRGYRHELASALALFDAVAQHDPLHPALLGPHRDLMDALDLSVRSAIPPREAATGALAELLALDAEAFDLVAYLVCCHHGKVRGSWQSTPHDERYPMGDGLGPPLRGVRESDSIPETAVATAAGGNAAFPAVDMHLDPASLGLSSRYGSSWRERVAGLRARHGDPLLAYLETLLRVADVRASRSLSADPLLSERTRT